MPDPQDTPVIDVARTGTRRFEVAGISEDELRTALRLLLAARELQADETAARRDQLLRVMVVADMQPVASSAVAQADRLARHREKLVAEGAYTLEHLQALRRDAKPSTTRTWLSRKRKNHELFSVTFDGATLVPSFQVTEAGEPRTGLREVLAALASAELGGWETWTWLSSPSGWLSDHVPLDVLDKDLDAVVGAARRFASNLA